MKIFFPYIYERYLAKQIYAAFGFILFALVALFLFFDILSELGSVNGQYTLPLALLHVLLKAPSRISEIIPVAGLIGSIYVFAMLASQSEFTILRIAGLDVKRGLTTLAKISLPLIILTLIMSEWLGPYAESVSDQVRMKALGSAYESQFRTGVWVKDRLRDEDGSGPIRPGIRYVNVGKIVVAVVTPVFGTLVSQELYESPSRAFNIVMFLFGVERLEILPCEYGNVGACHP